MSEKYLETFGKHILSAYGIVSYIIVRYSGLLYEGSAAHEITTEFSKHGKFPTAFS